MAYRFFLPFLLLLFTFSTRSMAQSLSLEYTGELQSVLLENRYNFINLLWGEAELPLGEKFTLHCSAFGVARTRDRYILDDYQGFSNIENDKNIFGLAVAGVEYALSDSSSLFFGVRNLDEDYFTAPVTLLFTHSSGTIVPTIYNYPIAAFPYSSLGLHYQHGAENAVFKVSCYNGMGSDRVIGKSNVFRFSPKNDGVFALTELQLGRKKHNIYVGGCSHYGRLDDEDDMKVRTSAWTYGLLQVAPKTHLVGYYSRSFSNDTGCLEFVGLGAHTLVNSVELGVFTDYARYGEGDEFATELTCKVPVCDYFSVQPVLHFINNNSGVCDVVGVLRVVAGF